MVVQANKTIRVLNLRDNEISDAGMLPLGDALKVDFVLFREISSFALLLLSVTPIYEMCWNCAFVLCGCLGEQHDHCARVGSKQNN